MNLRIEKFIITNLESYLNKKLKDKYTFTSSFHNSAIQINGTEKVEDGKNTMFIRIGISARNEQVYISNIFVPLKLKYQNIGKDMIAIVYQTSNLYKYDTFLVDLTDGFYQRMLRRGASKCDQPDILHITENTKLN